jgi:hypothetical protein
MQKQPGKNTRKSKEIRFGNLLMYTLPVDEKKRPGIRFDLLEQESGVIGLVVIQWAFLEYALFVRTAGLVEKAKLEFPKDALSFSFSRRLRAFRGAAEKAIKSKATKKKIFNLISRIARAEGYRHKIAHGLWSYNPKRLEQLFAIDRRGRFEPFDVKKLLDFSDSIGELSFELIHPGGWRWSFFLTKDKKTGSVYGGGTPRYLRMQFRQQQESIKGKSRP